MKLATKCARNFRGQLGVVTHVCSGGPTCKGDCQPKPGAQGRLQTARAILARMGIKLTRKDGEYRVNYTGKSERYAYYTNDLDDAIATAQHMIDNRPDELKDDPRIGWKNL